MNATALSSRVFVLMLMLALFRDVAGWRCLAGERGGDEFLLEISA